MTKAFYHSGKLPITVYTYDTQSTKSIAIHQLTDSVYSRLMEAMGGGLAYTSLTPHATKHQTFILLTDLLFTGLNRTGPFDYHPLKLYDTGSYYVITGYLISIFIVFLSLFSILKMNQETALKSRLSMFHFSFEKLTLIRSLFSLCYTALWTVIGYMWILHSLPNTFESYNWPTVVIHLTYYVIMITLWITIIELISSGWLNYLFKMILTLFIVLCSGMIVPTIYFKHLLGGLFIAQPFSLVTNQMLEITLNNFILDTSPVFYSSLIISLILLAITLVWRYRR
jgi:ABC-2 type transport system permease protein